jgi:hypothetical protein
MAAPVLGLEHFVFLQRQRRHEKAEQRTEEGQQDSLDAIQDRFRDR